MLLGNLQCVCMCVREMEGAVHLLEHSHGSRSWQQQLCSCRLVTWNWRNTLTCQKTGNPVAAVSVLHCKASSTLNMSLLRLSHAKRWWGGERKRKRRGWKAPQETNPFSVRCLDANPQWKNVMSVCLHSVSPLLFCFRGSFILPLLLPHCFLQLFFFPFCLSYLLFFCTSSPVFADF